MLAGLLTLGGTAASEAASFGDVLRARFDELGVPGLGFAIVADGAIVEAGGLGVADVDTGVPVDAATPFRIASLTKPLAAALLLAAVRAGDADLERPLLVASSRYRHLCRPMKALFARERLPYLDGIACDSDAITVRHALTHTAATPPGSAFAYDGFLFGLLSDEIGDVTVGGGDDNFVRAVRERIVEPLELTRSAAGITDPKGKAVLADLASPHRRVGKRWITRPRLDGPLNAGAGFVASALDLAAIDIAYRDRLLGDADLWESMTTPTVLTDGSRAPYGMGWFVQTIDGRRIVWHHGYQPDAYSALWIKDVERGRTLVLLANGDGLAAGRDLHLGDLARSPVAIAFLSSRSD